MEGSGCCTPLRPFFTAWSWRSRGSRANSSFFIDDCWLCPALAAQDIGTDGRRGKAVTVEISSPISSPISVFSQRFTPQPLLVRSYTMYRVDGGGVCSITFPRLCVSSYSCPGMTVLRICKCVISSWSRRRREPGRHAQRLFADFLGYSVFFLCTGPRERLLYLRTLGTYSCLFFSPCNLRA